jgi:hypothetical protein
MPRAISYGIITGKLKAPLAGKKKSLPASADKFEVLDLPLPLQGLIAP